MRVVFDTVILVRALINPYSRCGRIVFDHADAYQLVISRPILMEYLEVLQRPEITRKYRSLATRDLHTTLDLVANATVVELTEIPQVARDPNDDPFLATATAGQEDYLVSEDRDLLDLRTHEGVEIITATTFLDRLNLDGA